MVCDASITSKSQENSPFYRSVWPGLKLNFSHQSKGRFYINNITIFLEIQDELWF